MKKKLGFNINSHTKLNDVEVIRKYKKYTIEQIELLMIATIKAYMRAKEKTFEEYLDYMYAVEVYRYRNLIEFIKKKF